MKAILFRSPQEKEQTARMSGSPVRRAAPTGLCKGSAYLVLGASGSHKQNTCNLL